MSCSDRQYFYYRVGKKFTTIDFSRHCPLFLLSRVGWMQGKALGSAAGKVIGNGM